jgi:periplasmic divalent cation tolerance protein
MADFIQVHTTTATREQAERIAQELVQRRVAACVQVTGPILSCYHWQGRCEQAEEWRCDAKTRGDWFDCVNEVIRSEHDYDVPEVVATPLVAISDPYRAWLDETLVRSA